MALLASSKTVICSKKVRSQVLSVWQVICGKCSEFKAENSRQSRVCRQCFLTQPVAPASPSPEGPTEPKESMVVGILEPPRPELPTPADLADCTGFPRTRIDWVHGAHTLLEHPARELLISCLCVLGFSGSGHSQGLGSYLHPGARWLLVSSSCVTSTTSRNLPHSPRGWKSKVKV